MKIKAEHYRVMLEEIRPLAGKVPTHVEYLKKQGKVQDMNKRIRWDLLWAARLGPWLSEAGIYDYANDDHIDTALRHIVDELGIASY
jgi:hypothetical protein